MVELAGLESVIEGLDGRCDDVDARSRNGENALVVAVTCLSLLSQWAPQDLHRYQMIENL